MVRVASHSQMISESSSDIINLIYAAVPYKILYILGNSLPVALGILLVKIIFKITQLSLGPICSKKEVKKAILRPNLQPVELNSSNQPLDESNKPEPKVPSEINSKSSAIDQIEPIKDEKVSAPKIDFALNFYNRLFASTAIDLVFDLSFLLLVVISNSVLKSVTRFAVKFHSDVLSKVVICALVEIIIDLILSGLYVYSWRKQREKEVPKAL